MLSHIDPYKYPDRIAEVEKEIALRKQQGEIPTRLVPETDWSSWKFWKWRRKKKVKQVAG